MDLLPVLSTVYAERPTFITILHRRTPFSPTTVWWFSDLTQSDEPWRFCFYTQSWHPHLSSVNLLIVEKLTTYLWLIHSITFSLIFCVLRRSKHNEARLQESRIFFFLKKKDQNLTFWMLIPLKLYKIKPCMAGNLFPINLLSFTCFLLVTFVRRVRNWQKISHLRRSVII